MASCSVRGIGVADKGQHMHLGAHVLQPLLMLDTEMLLLVDDDETQILEVDTPCAEHRVRADDDIDLARVSDSRLGDLHDRPRRHHARQLRDIDRQVREPVRRNS